jgi:hypothetical protein
VVVLRQTGWALAELIAGGGLLAAHFLIHGQSDLFSSLTGGASVGLLIVAVLASRFRYEVRADGVSRAGLVREALAGQQWRPRPRG